MFFLKKRRKILAFFVYHTITKNLSGKSYLVLKLKIMDQFMLLILNKIDHQKEWSPETHKAFLKACEKYIGELKSSGKLISAQPLVREGIMLAGKAGAFSEKPFNEKEEVQVGYYHIYAADLKEACEIAKKNPEFEFSSTARIEVRPVKTKEKTTGFNYH